MLVYTLTNYSSAANSFGVNLHILFYSEDMPFVIGDMQE